MGQVNGVTNQWLSSTVSLHSTVLLLYWVALKDLQQLHFIPGTRCTNETQRGTVLCYAAFTKNPIAWQNQLVYISFQVTANFPLRLETLGDF